MAELHLKVTYKKKQMRPVLWAAYCIFPLWSLIAPFLLSIFIVTILFHGLAVPPIWTGVIVAVLFSVFLSGLLYTAFAEDKNIHITKEGISFPLFMLKSLNFRRHRNWDELGELDYIESDNDKYLNLSFKPDCHISLSCQSIEKKQMEEMLLALELWGKTCERSSKLIAYQKEIQNINSTGSDAGYTQIWEEELARRFHATTFIPLEPGTKLKDGSLVVERQIAFGGLSAIYLVQKDKQDLFVLKEAVVPQDVDDENKKIAERHLETESKMLFSVSHPNIANVVDYFVEEGRNYLLMEYINGQDLRQLVGQNEPQNEAVVVDWSLQIANAVKYLHELSPPIIHRDITPDNIVRREDGSIIIIDFGAANEFVGTATGTLIGKQAYIAPEQLRGKARPESDIYALGGTMFFLLTGRDPVPLDQPDLESVLPGSNKELSDLLKKMTEFETEDRIDSAKTLIPILEEVKAALKQTKTNSSKS